MRYSVSDTAEFGDLTRGPRVIDEHVREKMQRAPATTSSAGAFAKEWIADMDSGEARLQDAARAGGRGSGSSRSARSCAGSCTRGLREQQTLRPDVASVDVPVALLGYGTVGAAVHRLLVEQGDEIERATGHRLRVVARARPRRRARSAASRPSPASSRPTSQRSATTRRSRVVAEVMGGLDPAGGHVLELLAGRQARRHGEQAARRAARRRALRGGRRRAASSCASRRPSAPRSR